ncbi:hypothetical protein AVEN_132468-1 [Araneus ventricosus]|uniref:Uncharacterized protein n=1 Tax=Araneus ventricosus TaxID=182803 RepID=A0A4Y1ZS50_ARAVE|nr:hypothetical protein AVEN_141489-1 [Araneus ventricosus]GBM22681.1 hypothetical protein AVEN_132468-1 [Araneus ventricosus]
MNIGIRLKLHRAGTNGSCIDAESCSSSKICGNKCSRNNIKWFSSEDENLSSKIFCVDSISSQLKYLQQNISAPYDVVSLWEFASECEMKLLCETVRTLPPIQRHLSR